MRAQLPLASYLFILRRHLWLVLGVMAAVLAGGWFYAESEKPAFRSTAIVYIQLRGRDPGDVRASLLGEDPLFIANQVYLVRNDKTLAARVLDYLRHPPAPGPAEGARAAPGPGPEDPAAPRPRLKEPPFPGPEPFGGTTPESLRGRVAVAAIPATSYYEFTVTGPDARVNYAIVNAYAKVFEEVFRENGETRFEASLRETRRALKESQDRKKDADDAIAEFKKTRAQAGVDLTGERGGSAKENVDSLRTLLAQKRSGLLVLLREQKSLEETLAAVGLALRDDPTVGTVLGPVLGPEPEKDPRLSERVQSLDLVAQHEAVRKALAGIESVDAEIARLKSGPGLSETATEIKALRARRGDLQEGLARATEAALLKHAQDVVQTRGVVDDWTTQIGDLERAAGEEAVARAELERLQKAAAAVQEDIDRATKIILDAESQQKRFAESGGTVRVHAYAQPSETGLLPPNRPVIYLGTLILALLLGGGLAYVLEYLDDTVKTREDFDRLVRLPFLGYVPHLVEAEPGDRDLVVARGKTGTPEVEAFRSLRTGIQFSRPDHEVRAFLITSAGPGEGKTTVAINIATAFTGGKGRILLVDADLRRARVHAALGIANDRGLTNVLVGECGLEAAVQTSNIPGLDVLASGPIPPNPAEVLGSERMQQVLRESVGKYDRVVVDSPPLVAVTDPALLAKYVDAVFLVISIGKTSIRTIQRAQETLATVGAAVHGAILNDADVRTSGYSGYYGGYGYGYGYGYGSRDREESSRA